MKNISHLMILFLALFIQQIKAEMVVTFNKDSVPPLFKELNAHYANPEKYLPLWNKIKQSIDAEKGDKTADYYFLYKSKINFEYDRNNLDSLKKYTPLFKDLCLKLNDEYQFYRSWELLCETMLFTNSLEEEAIEHQKMYKDALDRDSKIGIAYSVNRIGMSYAVRNEYAKAQPYLKQAIQLFKEMEYWNEYISQISNYIIVLLNIDKHDEALETFQHLDSLANAFIKSDHIAGNASRILMIKDMASEIYNEPEDSAILKKYLNEMEALYKIVPDAPRFFLFNSKAKYAGLRNNLPEKIAYQDSSAQYYIKNHNMVNLSSTYNSMSKSLYQAHRYEEAYLTLRKYVNLNDSINKKDFQKQLNEMSTRYNMNKLELDAQKARMETRNMQYYYACILIIILIITIIIGIKFYLHKLKSNRLLKQQAQALIQANEKAHKAQQMKNAFIQNMNHEVRTPLNSIVGFSECLAEIPMGPEEVKEISTTIKKNSDNLLKIISDMLTIANIDSDESRLTREDIALNTFCSDLTHEMLEFAQKGVNLYCTLCDNDYCLNSNEDTIHQILVNLLHNALKFTQSGEVELSYQVDKSRKEIRFYVRDTGPGVDKELKEKIFERFYKVDSFIPGTGLGLSLCRVLADRLRAQVYLDDSYQGGCLFVFAHPLK